jgi:hypothetical protein
VVLYHLSLQCDNNLPTKKCSLNKKGKDILLFGNDSLKKARVVNYNTYGAIPSNSKKRMRSGIV